MYCETFDLEVTQQIMKNIQRAMKTRQVTQCQNAVTSKCVLDTVLSRMLSQSAFGLLAEEGAFGLDGMSPPPPGMSK